MEDVLAVSARPYDPAHPVVCLDETSRQLLGETREPLPVTGPGSEDDPEYVRGGVAQLFLVTEPLRGGRAVTVGPTDPAGVRPVRQGVRGAQIRMLSVSFWSWTSSIRTARRPCMQRFRPQRPDGWPRNWRSTTRRSMGAG